MPIYEYKCRSCGADFEVLVRGDEAVACGCCAGGAVDKKFSSFAVGSAKSSRAAPTCACAGFDSGRCGSGLCGDH